MMEAGMDKEVIMKTINNILMLKLSDEIFSHGHSLSKLKTCNGIYKTKQHLDILREIKQK